MRKGINVDIKKYMAVKEEKPLDNIVTNGGFCGIFRKIACVGDSLSSGEFESHMDGVTGWHDYFGYSWGQYLARDAGCTVYNFSKGGMSAKGYCSGFADENDFWNIEKRCQAYIIALGVNDMNEVKNKNCEFGAIDDIDFDNCNNNAESFVGYYAEIIQRYQKNQPKAKFFLMAMPDDPALDKELKELYQKHREILYKLTEVFQNCYVIDLYKYAPIYDEEFKKSFYLAGHMNAAGYRLTALIVESYIDYIIRHNPDDFRQIGFVGTEFYNENYKW